MNNDERVWEAFQQALMIHLDNWDKLSHIEKVEILSNGRQYVRRLYELPNAVKPVDIHPSVLKAQYER